jgi:hypothetical protein
LGKSTPRITCFKFGLGCGLSDGAWAMATPASNSRAKPRIYFVVSDLGLRAVRSRWNIYEISMGMLSMDRTRSTT